MKYVEGSVRPFHVPPQKICHIGAIVVRVGGEILVVKNNGVLAPRGARLFEWPVLGCLLTLKSSLPKHPCRIYLFVHRQSILNSDAT